MRKIKSDSGVTLMILVITIIILLILVGISFNMGINNVQDTKDDITRSELYIVQQAIIQQYSKIQALGEDASDLYIGNKIQYLSNINTSILSSKGIASPFTENDYSTNDKCYYRISGAAFESLNITGVKDNYIVKYSTGEVYNETKQVDSKGKILYIESKTNTLPSTDVDTNFSNDIWN